MNYTWSHAFDELSDTFSSSGNQFNLGYTNAFLPSVDYSNAQFDNRHRIALAAIYNIPFARGLHGFAKRALDGWELAPVLTARTGAPYTIYDLTNDQLHRHARGRDPGDPGERQPNRYGRRERVRHLRLQHDQVSELPQPEIGLGRFWTVAGRFHGPRLFPHAGHLESRPGDVQVTRITERVTLQLRLEAYNLFNHSNLYVNWGSAYVVGGAGNITASYGNLPNTDPQQYENRNIQLGAKLIF